VAFTLRSQSSSRFSVVSNLFVTAAGFDFTRYCPEMPLTSGEEARYTDVRAPPNGEIENGSDRYATSRRAPGARSIMRVRTIPGCTAFTVTDVAFNLLASSSVNMTTNNFVAAYVASTEKCLLL
jgi:hypothetical protein